MIGAKAAHLVLHAAVQAMPEQAKLAQTIAETLNAEWTIQVARDNLRRGENKTPFLIDLRNSEPRASGRT
jgi:hypothetical protein